MSHHSMFSVKWRSRCFLCRNPLEPFLVIHNHSNDFFKKLIYFNILRPYPIENNSSFLKIIDLKCKKVCACCFKEPPHLISPQQLRQREITGKLKRPKHTSLSDKDIYDWHEALYRFINRPDAEDYFRIES